MNDNIRLEILNAGKSLQLDEVRTILCPFCQRDWIAQGKPESWKPAESFSLKRVPAGYVYICFRASCTDGNKGGILSSSADKPAGVSKKKSRVRYFSGELSPLSTEVYDLHLQQYGIVYFVFQKENYQWWEERQRIYIPIVDHRGYEIGANAKTVVNSKPKTIMYPFCDDVPLVHWPLLSRISFKDTVVLVEDQISALKVAHVAPSVSINGTHISEDMIKYFINLGIKQVKIMFDPDAVGKAIKYKSKYHGVFANVDVISTTQDPKWYSFDQLQKVLNI